VAPPEAARPFAPPTHHLKALINASSCIE
jgi:hypothetical protein